MSMSITDSMLTKGTIKARIAQLSVMPRSVFRSALGSLGSALAAAVLAQRSMPCALSGGFGTYHLMILAVPRDVTLPTPALPA
jgi:hypothetical protein